ncbi:MAG: branched-chain amino acid ABC transporter permease [Acidimicrobiia bacterium]|nr:branched-chain amino acid ABC transporter permease [Acidimicrobiia bacterium]
MSQISRYTSYRHDSAILPSTTQRLWLIVLIAVTALLPLYLVGLSDGRSWLILGATAFVASIGAIGLNIVSGYAGLVSLGQAFFLGVGAYTAAALGGEGETAADGSVELIGLGLDMIIWLPAAGLVAGLTGIIVAPLAMRLQGLYLALVTLGLVFLGEHIFRNWERLTGGVGQGRESAQLSLFGYRFDLDAEILGFQITREQQIYWLMLVILVVMAVLAKNLVRAKPGRAFAAIRDRGVAAEMMGVDQTRYKTMAFAISSFYAGIAGGLLFTITGFVEPTSFNLLLSIAYIAMIVIGGLATIAGSIMGAVFVTLLPKLIDVAFLATIIEWVLQWIPVLGSASGDPPLGISQIERILFGVLIIAFLIFEPMGLYGIWIRIRNYWKAFPFSY